MKSGVQSNVPVPSPLSVKVAPAGSDDVESDGVLPSASLSAAGPGLYEPIHGSAPDIAGQDIANPCGAILSVGMLLRHSLELPHAADAVELAVHEALEAGSRTADLAVTGGEKPIGTVGFGDAVLARLSL